MTPPQSTVRLEHEMALSQTALHRLVFLLQERGLLTAAELDAVRELLPPVVTTSRRSDESEGDGDTELTIPDKAAASARRQPSKRARPVKPPATPADRQAIGRLGAHVKWAKTVDRSAATQAARDGLYRRFEDEVDPDRKLPADERAKRVDSARRAYYQRLALKSAQSRRARKAKP